MISHENKCIFVHIPKVAGTSIVSIFDDKVKTKSENRLLLPFCTDANKFDPPPTHLRITDHVKYGHVSKEMFDEYFKFTFVRNPWDRIVSEYKYRRHASRYDFKTFLFERFPEPLWSDEYCHVIPQYDFLYGKDGQCLMDFIGKFENIQHDFNVVCSELGLPDKKLVHKNRSFSLFRRDNNIYQALKTIRDYFSVEQKKNTFSRYTEYYDQESIDFVTQLYRKDVETFGYKFGE